MPEADVSVVTMATRVAGEARIFQAGQQGIDVSSQHKLFSGMQGCPVSGTKNLETGQVYGISRVKFDFDSHAACQSLSQGGFQVSRVFYGHCAAYGKRHGLF